MGNYSVCFSLLEDTQKELLETNESKEITH